MDCPSTRGSACTSVLEERSSAPSAAMRLIGSVAEWEQWTGMDLPESGVYVVPGALVPIEIDRERDVGRYLEPACWVRHRVAAR